MRDAEQVRGRAGKARSQMIRCSTSASCSTLACSPSEPPQCGMQRQLLP